MHDMYEYYEDDNDDDTIHIKVIAAGKTALTIVDSLRSDMRRTLPGTIMPHAEYIGLAEKESFVPELLKAENLNQGTSFDDLTHRIDFGAICNIGNFTVLSFADMCLPKYSRAFEPKFIEDMAARDDKETQKLLRDAHLLPPDGAANELVLILVDRDSTLEAKLAQVLARTARDAGSLVVAIFVDPSVAADPNTLQLDSKEALKLKQFVDAFMLPVDGGQNSALSKHLAVTLIDNASHYGVLMQLSRFLTDRSQVVAYLGSSDLSDPGRAIKAAHMALENQVSEGRPITEARTLLVYVTLRATDYIGTIHDVVEIIRARVGPHVRIVAPVNYFSDTTDFQVMIFGTKYLTGRHYGKA